MKTLQKLQNRAARIVTGSSYDAPSVPLRKELGWLSVKEMIIVKETSTMMYKSLNDLAPQYLSDLFVRLSDFHTRELRNTKNDLAVPLMRKVSGQKAFSYRGTKVWNKFNNDIKEAPSVYSFKSRLRQLGYVRKSIILYIAYCRQMYIFLSINLFVNSLLGTLILTGPNCKTISLLNLYPV